MGRRCSSRDRRSRDQHAASRSSHGPSDGESWTRGDESARLGLSVERENGWRALTRQRRLTAAGGSPDYSGATRSRSLEVPRALLPTIVTTLRSSARSQTEPVSAVRRGSADAPADGVGGPERLPGAVESDAAPQKQDHQTVEGSSSPMLVAFSGDPLRRSCWRHRRSWWRHRRSWWR